MARRSNIERREVCCQESYPDGLTRQRIRKLQIRGRITEEFSASQHRKLHRELPRERHAHHYHGVL